MDSLLAIIIFGGVVFILTLLGVFFALREKKEAIIITLFITLIWFFITIIWRYKDIKDHEKELFNISDILNMDLSRTKFKEGKYFYADSLYQEVSDNVKRIIQPEIELNKQLLDLISEISNDLYNEKPEQAKEKLIFIARLNPLDPSISQQIENCDSLIKNKTEKTTQPNALDYNSKGLRYSAMGDNVKAIENYSLAINLNQNYYQAYRNRSIQYENLGKHHLAFEDADKAVKIRSTGPNYEQRGNIYFALGKYSAAVDDYKIAIDYYDKTNTQQWYDGKKVTYQPANENKARVLDKLKSAEELNIYFKAN